MKVKDIMATDSLKYCTSETKLASAAKMMKETNRGALPVLDKAQKVIGIVTDRDICLSIANRPGKAASQIRIKEILPSSSLQTVKPGDSVAKVLQQMRTHKIGRLPVTDKEGKLKGMISINTLLSRALSKQEEIGNISSTDETLAKTIKTLFDRNNSHNHQPEIKTVPL